MKVNYPTPNDLQPNVDILNDFARLQRLNRELGKSNVKFVGEAMDLRCKISNVMDHPIYISDLGKSIPLKDAFKYLTEDWVDSGQMTDATAIDLISALKILI